MKKVLLILSFWLIALLTFSQNDEDKAVAKIMFYNCENLFDTEDDPDKWDEEFLPDTAKYWTKYRYNKKLFQIYQVITAVGKWNPPAFIGLCEIENRKTLEDLISKTPLFNAGYEIIHYESPDGRGIDVAALYLKSKFKPLEDYPIKVDLGKKNRTTRDILYVKGLLNSGDTLHIFVNHWPSRWGGQVSTEPKRMKAAQTLKFHVDSLNNISQNPNIIITGDLNDYPHNKSLTEVLQAQTEGYENPLPSKLYNLSSYLEKEKKQGSHKYHGEWGVLDQFIVSGTLLQKTGIYTEFNQFGVFMADFLLEDDEKNTGKQPKRTYIGYKYHGGYSDHLPVYLNIFR